MRLASFALLASVVWAQADPPRKFICKDATTCEMREQTVEATGDLCRHRHATARQAEHDRRQLLGRHHGGEPSACVTSVVELHGLIVHVLTQLL